LRTGCAAFLHPKSELQLEARLADGASLVPTPLLVRADGRLLLLEADAGK